MRYDLAFFLCCCKSFLGSDESSDYTNFYDLLDIERDATNDEIKKAYKRKSLQMHPDKLAQHGKVITEEDQSKFTRMKEAYEILSDQHKRDTYDVIGERGMKWIEEPFAMDPQELARNFSKSSIVDRSKIFAIFVGLVVATTILPIMVCLHVDGVLGDNAPWLATLTPLWLWNFFVLFYHSRVIMMGKIQRPDHVPLEEWVDPLPMQRRVFSLFRFFLLFFFELLVAMKLDNLVVCNWVVIFIPLYIWEATTLLKKWPLARLRIVTVDDLETAMGKPFVEFTTEEKELIGKRYSVVVSTTSTDFEIAQKLKERARKDMMKCIFRIIFITILIVQLDTSIELNWWIVFTPFWIMTFLICVTNYQVFAEVQLMAVEKDPTLFGLSSKQEGGNNSTNNNYGSVGDGAATPEATSTAAAASLQSELTEDEREELKAQVINGGSKLCSKCCSQGLLLILMLLVLAKLQGAGFSSLWIISPFLLASGIILCCLGCAIFGISEVPSEGIVDSGHFVGLVDGSAEATDGTVASPSPIIIDSNNASLSVVSTEPSLIDTEIGGRENSLLPSSQQIATPIIEPTPVQDQSLIESKGTMELRELD
mmetsp:Transcript_69439/g.77670  ORF Transcript_69439/g.77670 Transcript_69439/m.77670 type:complete len:594 (-) Transcript_69439:9-1790(-)